MALMGCLGCEDTYEVGLPRCPHCGTRSPMFVGGEDEMPKATTGGASNAWLENEPGYQPPVESEAAPVEAAEVPADAEVSPDEEPVTAETGVSDGPPAEAAAPALPPLESMSKAELQDHADSLGLPISGSKADLAARIVEHHEAVAADAPPESAAIEPEA